MSSWAQQGGNHYLRQQLDALDVLIYPLLRWLVTTNKAHLRKLRPDEQFESLGSAHQFVLMSGPIEREQQFQRLKQRANGSLFLGTGRVGQLARHSRTSLKNMSGTKHMSAGEAVSTWGPLCSLIACFYRRCSVTHLSIHCFIDSLCVRHQYGRASTSRRTPARRSGTARAEALRTGPSRSSGTTCSAWHSARSSTTTTSRTSPESRAPATRETNCGIVVPQEETSRRASSSCGLSRASPSTRALVKDAIQQGKLTFLADHGNNEDGDGDAAMEGVANWGAKRGGCWGRRFFVDLYYGAGLFQLPAPPLLWAVQLDASADGNERGGDEEVDCMPHLQLLNTLRARLRSQAPLGSPEARPALPAFLA